MSPEDKGTIVLHLHRLHRDLGVPVSPNTIDAHIDLKARPRQTD